jgi:transposase
LQLPKAVVKRNAKNISLQTLKAFVKTNDEYRLLATLYESCQDKALLKTGSADVQFA